MTALPAPSLPASASAQAGTSSCPVSDDLPGPERIATSRLDLVPLALDDAEEMVDVLAGDELYAFTGGSPPTLAKLRRRYATQAVGHSADDTETWHNWIVRTRTNGRAIGYVQATITDHGRHAEIAWVIGLEWQGRGYATEAATVLVDWLDARGVTRITANVHPDNLASESVARRIRLLPTDRWIDGERTWSRDPIEGD